ncbi:hypothetical protein H4J02_07310 [Protaetiibacter sp. SSC-01]|uniref:hypothetical protein n=1 Tax=Protaetiibacter sp. SSC-01 TaxID=2759943 RepID=UPI0016569CCB|nr:hypothetical protein [Protaetiibacter sp. SSC-01]QNO38984.1 hypothetical protein H4J02_07310 [Protaetiibacter sp. SSC-01]
MTQTGVLTEGRRGGLSSRLGRNRADVKHAWLDPLLVAGPWVFLGVLAGVAVRGVVRSPRR